MSRMPWRWGSVCLAYAVWGCALLDQPIEGPASSSDVATTRSRYEPIVSVCECGAERAERDLQRALAALETDANEQISPPAFDACVNSLTGVPSIVPLTSASRDRPRLDELRRQIEAQKLTWHVHLHPEGHTDVSVFARSGAPAEGLVADLRPRVLPTLRAFESAHLASQLCHSTALFIAIEAQLSEDRSQRSVVNRLAMTARRLDGVAAASTGILLELRRLARTTNAKRPTQIVRFHSLEFDGEFASDGDDVERNARRRVDELRRSGALPKPGNANAYVKDVALPFWLAPRPRLSALCRVPESNPTEAVAAGLPALREGDLGRIMLSARNLYPPESTARQGLASVCALFTGNDRNALRRARDMVPGYSSTGQLLSTLTLEPG
jgi:hypothetical protein